MSTKCKKCQEEMITVQLQSCFRYTYYEENSCKCCDLELFGPCKHSLFFPSSPSGLSKEFFRGWEAWWRNFLGQRK